MNEISTNISQRLKMIRSDLGLSQVKMAALFNMPQTTYSKYELGGSIPEKILQGLHDKGYNIVWLITGEGSMYIDKDETAEDALRSKNYHLTHTDVSFLERPATEYSASKKDESTLLIPMTNMKLSAGKGWNWESEEIYTGELLPVPMKIARRFDEKNLIAATVKGDSMEPTLHDGEPVAYVKEFENGDGIYALAILDEVYIKRLSIDKLKKEITIISDNPKYPAKTYPMDQEGLQVLGKVVFWIHVE